MRRCFINRPLDERMLSSLLLLDRDLNVKYFFCKKKKENVQIYQIDLKSPIDIYAFIASLNPDGTRNHLISVFSANVNLSR